MTRAPSWSQAYFRDADRQTLKQMAESRKEVLRVARTLEEIHRRKEAAVQAKLRVLVASGTQAEGTAVSVTPTSGVPSDSASEASS